MMKLVLFLSVAICLIAGIKAVEVKMQVDDNHWCQADGQDLGESAAWKNTRWNQVYTYNVASISVLACYFRNGGGPKGVMMTFDGEPTDYAAWKCKAVGGADGSMLAVDYDDSTWSNAVAINGPSKSFPGGQWWWGPSGNQVICRLTAQVSKTTINLQVDNNLLALTVDDENIKTNIGLGWTQLHTYHVSGSASFVAAYGTNAGGPGGMVLSTSNGIISDGTVKCKVVPENTPVNEAYLQKNFDASDWKDAKDLGQYGVGPWGDKNKIVARNARWIWCADPNVKQKDGCVCRFGRVEIYMQVDNFVKGLYADDTKIETNEKVGWTSLQKFVTLSANFFALHVANSGGPEAMVVKTSNGISSDVNVKCKAVGANEILDPEWFEEEFDDSAWLNAKDMGRYGVAPWRGQNKHIFGEDAHWIWAADSKEEKDECVCRFRRPINGKCVKDNASRVMIKRTMESSGSQSIERCKRRCASGGYRLCGLQYSRECFCSNDYDFDRLGKADNCNMKCTGNKDQICGGTWAMSVYETGAVATNLAFGKTAMQSSETQWNGYASRAVDGIMKNNWGDRSCTHTQNEQAAWWAVDLGCKKKIYRVTITNRKDCCSNRLANFQMGATRKNPILTAPAKGNYRACATHTGAVGAGETMAFDCIAIGRYFVVQLLGKNYLTLCEVKVYGH